MRGSSIDRRRGLAWAFASSVGGAFMAIPWKLANEVGDPGHSVLLLLFTAATANSLFLIGQRATTGTIRFRTGPRDFAIATALAVVTLLGNLASAWSIRELTPALLNVLLRVDVLFVAILGWAFLGERVERRFWLGASIAGVGLMVLQSPTNLTGESISTASGTGLAIAAAACFSTLAILTRRFIHEIDPVAVNSLRLWISVALWLAFNGVSGVADIPSDQFLYATIAGLAGPFASRLALMISARYVEARVTTLASLSNPVLTLGFAFLLISDWPETHELIGGAIMMGGIAIPLLRKVRNVRAHANDAT